MYEEIVLTLTLGYFLFDFIWIINYQTESLAMYFHHGASILCLAVILAKGYSGFEVLVGKYFAVRPNKQLLIVTVFNFKYLVPFRYLWIRTDQSMPASKMVS